MGIPNNHNNTHPTLPSSPRRIAPFTNFIQLPAFPTRGSSLPRASLCAKPRAATSGAPWGEALLLVRKGTKCAVYSTIHPSQF
jgi:hypothetical protein